MSWFLWQETAHAGLQKMDMFIRKVSAGNSENCSDHGSGFLASYLEKGRLSTL